MKNWLGIHLEHKAPDESTPVAWALFDGNNQLITQGQGPLGRVRAQAGREAEKAEVYVYVPGSSVNLAEVTIPSRQIAHLRKALPFMIGTSSPVTCARPTWRSHRSALARACRCRSSRTRR